MIPALGQNPLVPATVSLRLRTVLLVDEALPIRRKLVDILHRAGIAPTATETATGPAEAMEVFARTRPSLVFAELVGEDVDEGLGMVLEMLRIDPQAKIVLLTAEDPGSPVVRQAVRAGVYAVVRKPLRHDAIRQVLTEIEAEEGGIERFR